MTQGHQRRSPCEKCLAPANLWAPSHVDTSMSILSASRGRGNSRRGGHGLTACFSGIVLAFAACDSPHTTTVKNAVHPSTSTTRPTPATTTTVTAVQTTTTTMVPQVVASIRCQPSDLSVTLGPPVSEETEQDSLLVEITNKSGDACYLFGYPGISFYDSEGALLPLAYERTGDQMVTSAPPQRVSLAAGGTAYVLMNESSASICVGPESVSAATLNVIPPDTTSSFTLDLQGQRNIYACSGPTPARDPLAISPVEQSAEDTFAPLPTP
jgi:hypothetical protein